ncbi:MAG: hypothetical protein GC162_09985 [Planctomycetes bacterium]|nr:hypothetical protein [Planctomycetota bacterium]
MQRISNNHYDRLLPDLDHGNEQVRKMLADRKAMTHLPLKNGGQFEIAPDSFPWKWVAMKYGGDGYPNIIFWNGKQVNTFNGAKSRSPNKGRPGIVWVSAYYLDADNQEIVVSGEELWYNLVFEFHNMQWYDKDDELVRKARYGLISRNNFIRSVALCEYYALMETVTFYQVDWKPWAEANGIYTDSSIWRIESPKTFDEFYQLHAAAHDGYPEAFYGPVYDNLRKSGPAGTGQSK